MSKHWFEPSPEDEIDYFPKSKPEPIPFDKERWTPLNFQPAETITFAVIVARKMLSKRTNEHCMVIANAVANMDFIVKAILGEKTISSPLEPNYIQAWQFSGRTLFQCLAVFDISQTGVKKLEWFEVFAVKVLMLCAHYSRLTISDSEGAALTQAKPTESLYQAVVDCLARAEVLEKHGRTQTSAKQLGSKGGKARTLKIQPLENIVMKLYLEECKQMPILKAANCIAAILAKTQPELLELTKNKEKAIAIQNIIRKYKDGKTKYVI
ncbi:hypothetical protein ACFO3I_06695 [Rheinheimera marina]|uniref:Uncharacterized protein n=1 Tax=Rheinheimera marina TaxID=1774958 RepID=A0ABV9JKD8_9GAMM